MPKQKRGKGKPKRLQALKMSPVALPWGTVNPPPTGLLDTKTTQQSPPLQINTGKKSPLGGDTSNDADQSISAPFQPMRYEEGSRAEPVIPSHEGSDSPRNVSLRLY